MARSKKQEEERIRLMAMVPAKLPKDVDAWIEDEGMDQFIFYNKPLDYAFCTRCNAKLDERLLEARNAVHNQEGKCPVCRHEITYKCIGRFKHQRMLWQDFQFIIAQKIPEGILIRRFELVYEYFKNGSFLNVRRSWRELQRVFNDGIRPKNYRGFQYRYTGEDSWAPTKMTVYNESRAMGNTRIIRSMEYCRNLKQVIKGTCFEYARTSDLETLSFWIRPMEYLQKAGMNELVFSLKHMNYTGLNLNGDSLEKFFRIPKQYVKMAISSNFSLYDLQSLRSLIKGGCTNLTAAVVKKFTNNQSYYQNASRVAPISLPAFIRYLSKDRASALYFYEDYLRFCRQLGYDMTDPMVLFPNDIKAAHDREHGRLKLKENEAVSQRIAQRYLDEHEAYDWQADGLFIRPARDMAELLREGSALNHCVGTYAQRVADGPTLILLIRKEEAPEVPYYTMEWTRGKVIQCRGQRNCDPDPEVKEFITRYENRNQKKQRVRQTVAV